MKYIVLICFSIAVFAQDVIEKANGKTLTYKFENKRAKGAFIALPNTTITIVSQRNITIEYAFRKRGNKFYEITSLSKNAKLVIRLDVNANRFLRKKASLSLNRLFFLPFEKRRKGKSVKLASLYSSSYLTNPNSIIIKTDKRAVYKITHQYLIQKNIDISSIDVSHFRLYNKGNEVPVFIEAGKDQFINESGDYFLFVAELSKNNNFPESTDIYYDPYDYRNVYILAERENTNTNLGKRMFLKNGLHLENNDDLIFKSEFFERTVHLEENTRLRKKDIQFVEEEYSNKGIYHNRDHVFWGKKITDETYESYDISILDDYYKSLSNEDSVTFTIMMSGSVAKYEGRHEVEFKVSSGTFFYNNNDNWRKSFKEAIKFKIPYSFLKADEKNTFEVIAKIKGDQLLLNSIDIHFKSQLIARNNYLEFNAIKSPGHPDAGKKYTTFQYEVSGFDKNMPLGIIKLNEAVITNFEEKIKGGTKKIIFQDEIENANSQFIIYPTNFTTEPVSITMNKIYADKERLLEKRSDAEMIIITTSIFYKEAKKYAAYKTAQKLKTEVVLSEKIYAEFNFGHESPVAIRNFIKYAYENWSSDNALQYVLLVGDAKFNYITGNKLDNVIPTFQFISEKYGLLTSDAYYGYLHHSQSGFVDFNKNPIMDVYIGRIPAESGFEFNSYFSKIKEYEDALPQETNLFLTGNDYAVQRGNKEYYTGKRVFVSQASRYNNNFFNISNASILKRAADDPPNKTNTVLQVSSELQNLFNKGLNYITFNGHGAGSVWGDKQIMQLEDAERLQNSGKYPFVASFTCFVVAFDNYTRTLGEEFILLRNKGAIGVLGATGVSLTYNQYMLGYYVNDYAFQNKYTFGEVMSLGKFKYYQRGAEYITDTSVEVTPQHVINKTIILMEFNYLGDPSIKIKFPEKKPVTSETDELTENSIFNLQVTDIPEDTYVFTAYIMDFQGEVIIDTSYVVSVKTGNLSQSFHLKKLTAQSIFYLKGSFKSNSKVFSFGKVLRKKDNLYINAINVVDPSTLQKRRLLAGGDYKLLIKLNRKATLSSASVTLSSYTQNTTIKHLLQFTSIGNNSFVSKQVFRVSKTDVDMEVFDIVSKFGTEEKLLRGKILSVISTKYLLKPVKNSLVASYTDKTKLQVTVAYPISYKNKLRVFTEFYNVRDKVKIFIAKDTVNFTRVNENLISRVSVLENYDGKDSHYYVRIYSDSVNLELDTANQKLYSSTYSFPNTLIDASTSNLDTIKVSEALRVVIALTKENFINNSASTLLKMKLVSANNNFQFSNFRNVFGNSVLMVTYYNYENNIDNFDNIESSNFKLLLSKKVWKGFDTNKLNFFKYDSQIKKWLVLRTKMIVNKVDTSLMIKMESGITKSALYALIELEKDEPFIVFANVEVNGISSEGVQYTGINPQIKFNLNSQYSGYVINPLNVSLTVQDNSNFSENLPFSYSYSGSNQENLNIIVENTKVLNEDGPRELLLKLKGSMKFVQLKKLSKGKAIRLSNNEFKQQLRISGNDAMHIYGNYPNPFGKYTIFSILLSSSESREKEINLKIKIYTMSGRLIKVIDKTNMEFVTKRDNPGSDPHRGKPKIGLNYIVWDGKNSLGDGLANGVYFAKVIFNTSSGTLERIIKLAKLNGYSR